MNPNSNNSNDPLSISINPNDYEQITAISTIESQFNEVGEVVDAENILIETEIQDVDDLNVDTDAEENLVPAQ
nr:hypothetical protein [Tanacetum cinerariifolium]